MSVAIVIVYLIGVLVASVGFAVLDERGYRRRIDLTDALGMTVLGILWPITVPMFAIAGFVMWIVRLLA
jgi:hypothetical protein